MRIMLLGAGGFIGGYLRAELVAHGHAVVGVGRRPGPDRIAVTDETDPAAWAPHLAGIDVIVNAAGVLHGRRLHATHVAMPRALYAAARDAGVRRVVLLSAISARPDVRTGYSRTKLTGEQVLRDGGLGWTILRPSLVYAEGSYGGTSLLRGLAALPVTMLPGDGGQRFTPVHARDLARAVRRVAEDEAFTGATLDPLGPETLTLATLLTRYRRWLGFAPAPMLRVPLPAMRVLGRLGDLASDGPVSSTSLAQLLAGNDGDPAAFARAIGFRPRSLDEALAASPAQVQDRWHARLFFVAPLIGAVLALTWLASGLLGFWHSAAEATAVTAALDLPPTWATPLRVVTSTLDLALAGLVASGRRRGLATLLQLATVAGYTIVIGWALPALWLDPFAPLLKNGAFVALVLAGWAVGEKR